MKSRGSRDGSALDCALRSMEKDAVEQTVRARRALDVLLHGVRTSCWPEVAWMFSTLTPDGYPLELTFSSSPEPAVRYALEVAGPEMPEHQRLREAFRLYRALVGHPASAEIERVLSAVQATHELSYGAWFGGSHTKTTDRYKIYAELPKDASVNEFPAEIFPGALPLEHCHSRPVMFGFQPESNVREVYFRTGSLAPEDIGRLLWKNNLSHRYHETLELIQATAGRPGSATALAGFSLAFNGDAKAMAVSLFTEAKFLFGSDANARRNLLKLARARCWPLLGYEEVSRAHHNWDAIAGNQGVVAWIATPDNPVELRISVRPPDPGSEHSGKNSSPSQAGTIPASLLV